jgi:cytochrome c553
LTRVAGATLCAAVAVFEVNAQVTQRTAARPATPRTATSHATMSPESQRALINEYCIGCHDDDGKAGGLSLNEFEPAHADRQADVAEKMIRKLRAGMMPPPAARTRPDAATARAFAEALEATIDGAAGKNPRPGWRPFQRLNRAEYARAVRDLLDVDVDASAFLPPDTISNGFDNVADAQTFSPALMEGYLRAASKVTTLALGDAAATASEASYKLPKTASQLQRADGAPLGTRGGVSIVHTFAADGEYVFRMDLFAEPLGLLFGSTAQGEQLEVSIDGARVALFDIDPRMSEQKSGLSLKTGPTHVKAGAARVTAAFVQRFEGPINDLVAPIDHTLADTEIGTAYGITTLPHLRSLNIVGPMHVTGVSDTSSRHRVFVCRPTSADDADGCAAEIVRTLATRAFRGPVSESHFARLMGFYEQGRAAHDFEYGIARAVEAILASPQFLFRLEPAPSTAAAGRPYRVSDLELASRLSFFLWDTGPDAELLSRAARGTLGAPEVLARQVRRMLASPKADALATRFAAQWLRLQDLDKVMPDPIQFPYYDKTLADAFKRETELFFENLVREDRSALDLITADYTFANERIARHYGIAGVTGNEFRRVSLPEYRRGILGQGSVLTLTSNPDRTSPVQRGKWVLEVLLGSPPPPPPPNVPLLDATAATAGGKTLSVRQRMEEHRANPACQSCHRVIDPIGLSLENFDPTGKWRIKDGESAVDAHGVLYDGTEMDGPAGLRAALLKHQDVVLRSFTERLMTYALGRRIEAADMPAVRSIVRAAEADNYRISSFIEGIVASSAFRMSGGDMRSEDW